MNYFKNKVVFITGVCGTIGSELLRHIINFEPKEVIGIDNNETELFFLSEEFRNYKNVNLFIGDIRDSRKLEKKMLGVNIVLHTAAFKHVILSEMSPQETVETNVLGTQNVINAAITNCVDLVLFTSSDKAVNPTNVMGTTKLLGERLVTAANAHKRNLGPIFSSTRFGNVLGSRGSVIPLFKKQISTGGPVTLTDISMSRFVMTLNDAVNLVLESVLMARGGEVFVTKMPIARIVDLASIMIDELAPFYGYDPKKIEIKLIGSKAGEKIYEELMNEEEARRSLELKKYFVIKPAFMSLYNQINYDYSSTSASINSISKPYNSSIETPMSIQELKDYLKKSNVYLP